MSSDDYTPFPLTFADQRQFINWMSAIVELKVSEILSGMGVGIDPDFVTKSYAALNDAFDSPELAQAQKAQLALQVLNLAKDKGDSIRAAE